MQENQTSIKLTQIEQSPNPNACRFVFNLMIVEEGVYLFNPENKNNIKHTFIEQIFDYPIEQVLIADNFITIVKKKEVDEDIIWYELKDYIQEEIQKGSLRSPLQFHQDFRFIPQSEIAYIDEFFLQTIMPATLKDGGAITVKALDNDIVYFNTVGACKQCPYVHETIQKGILPHLKNILPSIKDYSLLLTFVLLIVG